MISTDVDFLNDVIEGLTSFPKRIPSKYFYDDTGDKLFQEIMALDEYYLTRAEFEIFNTYKGTILDIINEHEDHFNLIEFGAGDGYKTKILLRHFIEKKAEFNYLPIDISQNVLDELQASITEEIPDLHIKIMQGDYFEVLGDLSDSTTGRNVILFLGSNIGNFTPQEVREFLGRLRNKMSENDLLLMGIDLKKEPRKILQAYNDKKGVTKEFNLNLLKRINKELDANFDIDSFWHYPIYNPVSGECVSMLISRVDQEVHIGASGQSFHFEKWEPIHTEISRKYSVKQLDQMARDAGFSIERNLFDQNEFFVETIWKAH